MVKFRFKTSMTVCQGSVWCPAVMGFVSCPAWPAYENNGGHIGDKGAGGKKKKSLSQANTSLTPRHLSLCLHNAGDSVVLPGVSSNGEKCRSEIRERERRAVGGRQIERSPSKVGQSVGSEQPVRLCGSV